MMVSLRHRVSLEVIRKESHTETYFCLVKGQHNDSRMNIALVMTAVHQGTVAANHTEVVALHKDANGKLNGARLKDNISGEEFDVKAKVSIFRVSIPLPCVPNC